MFSIGKTKCGLQDRLSDECAIRTKTDNYTMTGPFEESVLELKVQIISQTLFLEKLGTTESV